jgi:hypothetical protein
MRFNDLNGAVPLLAQYCQNSQCAKHNLFGHIAFNQQT